jgi:hypothetical protein
MKVVTQLAVFLENKPGTLAVLCETLAAMKIDVFALSVSDGVDHAIVRMVVSEPRKALHMFGERGTMVVEREVLMIEGESKPGEMASIAKKLAAEKVNIEYVYAAAAPGAKKGIIILRVDNMTRAKRVLGPQ